MVLKCVLLLVFCITIYHASPIEEYNQELVDYNSKLVVGRSSVSRSDLGFQSRETVEGNSTLLVIPSYDWIDPFGMAQIKQSQLKNNSIQLQIWHELFVGRKENFVPLLVLMGNRRIYFKHFKFKSLSIYIFTVSPKAPTFLTVLLMRLTNTSTQGRLTSWISSCFKFSDNNRQISNFISLELLPKTVPGPLTWDEDELQLLEGSPILRLNLYFSFCSMLSINWELLQKVSKSSKQQFGIYLMN